MAITEKLTAIADAIRLKTDSAAPIALEDMPLAISLIEGGEGGGSGGMKFYSTTYTVTADDVARFEAGELTALSVTLPKPASEDAWECSVWVEGDGGTGISFSNVELLLNDASVGAYPAIALGSNGYSIWGGGKGVLIRRVAMRRFAKYFATDGFSAGYSNSNYTTKPAFSTVKVVPTKLTAGSRIRFSILVNGIHFTE